MDKEMVIQAYGAILPNYKKSELLLHAATWMNIKINTPNKPFNSKKVTRLVKDIHNQG